jgi:hypothetical protein
MLSHSLPARPALSPLSCVTSVLPCHGAAGAAHTSGGGGGGSGGGGGGSGGGDGGGVGVGSSGGGGGGGGGGDGGGGVGGGGNDAGYGDGGGKGEASALPSPAHGGTPAAKAACGGGKARAREQPPNTASGPTPPEDFTGELGDAAELRRLEEALAVGKHFIGHNKVASYRPHPRIWHGFCGVRYLPAEQKWRVKVVEGEELPGRHPTLVAAATALAKRLGVEVPALGCGVDGEGAGGVGGGGGGGGGGIADGEVECDGYDESEAAQIERVAAELGLPHAATHEAHQAAVRNTWEVECDGYDEIRPWDAKCHSELSQSLHAVQEADSQLAQGVYTAQLSELQTSQAALQPAPSPALWPTPPPAPSPAT